MKFINPEREIDLTIGIVEAFILLSQLQLSLRHPMNIGRSAEIAKHIAHSLTELILSCEPQLAGVIEMGWNPDFDIHEG